MLHWTDSSWKSKYFRYFLGILVLSVIPLYEMIRFFFLVELPGVRDSHYLLNLMTFLHILCPGVIGIISDVHCRKKALTLCLTATCLAPIFFKVHWLFLGVLVEGIASGLVPVARAAFCDALLPTRRSANITLTFMVQALPWIFLRGSVLKSSLFLPMLSILTIVFLGGLLFLTKSEDNHGEKISLYNIVQPIKKYGLFFSIMLLLAFFLMNSQWNSILYYLDKSLSSSSLIADLQKDAGIYFFLASFSAMLITIIFRNDQSLKAAICSIFLILTIVNIVWACSNGSYSHIFLTYTLVGGSAISLTYFYIGNKVPVIVRGTVFGLIESLQSLTEYTGETFNVSSVGSTAMLWLPVLVPLTAFVCLAIAYFNSSKKSTA